MNDRLLSILGLCRRAGKIVIGTDPVIESVTTGKSFFVINRTKDELGMAIGKYCAVVSITDRGFSDKIQELILKEQEQEE